MLESHEHETRDFNLYSMNTKYELHVELKHKNNVFTPKSLHLF